MNKEEKKEYMRKYMKRYMSKKRNENPEKYRKIKRDWAKNNPDKIREMNLKYLKKHPENRRESIKRYRLNATPQAKERMAIRTYSNYKFKKLLLDEIGCCELCGSKVELVLHHLQYKNNRENIMLLCRKCHLNIHKRRIKK